MSDVQLYDNLTEAPVPKRKPTGHKGTFGKVLVIAGFGDMTGACVLCSESTLKAGTGLVKVYTSELTAGVLRVRRPELMVSAFAEEADAEKIKELCDWADVIAIGPGLSTSANAILALDTLLNFEKKALVLDADALNILAKRLDELCGETKDAGALEGVKRRLYVLSSILPAGSILTPHIGELGRLLGLSVKEVAANREKLADLTEMCFNGTIVMKDAVTLTVGESKRAENHHGNDGMATGGSGDVLTGLIAALRAQGASSFEAAAAGVRLHAEAGDRAAARHSRHSMTAEDLILEFDGIFRDLEK